MIAEIKFSLGQKEPKMTRLTILPFLNIQTQNPTECSIEYRCIEHFAESVDVPVEEFIGSESVTYYDENGGFVASMLYDAADREPFEKAEYFVQEIIVNVCGSRKLSEIVKDLCMYVTSVDDSFGDFNFSCEIEDGSALLLNEFAEFCSYSQEDKTMYFTYTV
jgi:hypothetical protein